MQTPNAPGERIAGPEPRLGVTAELLDRPAAAALLGISVRQLDRLAAKLPTTIRLGRRRLHSRAALLGWIAKQVGQ